MKKPSRKPGRRSVKPADIRDPAHPFHSFAKKEQPPAKKKNDEASQRGRSKGRTSTGIRHNEKAVSRTPFHQHEVSDDPPVFPLNKYLSHTGLCARRKAVEYIRSGEVRVNDRVVTEPGFKVTEKDTVQFRGKKLLLQRKPVYILLNKPKGYITTTSDPQDRKTVMELVSRATRERVYPVGRLDRHTSGLLLLTNDGELAQQLAHPSNGVKKVYHVVLEKPLTKHDLEHIGGGMELEDGPVTVDAVAYTDVNDKTQVGLEIHSGRNRVVRRIFEHLGYEVKALDRVLYAGLTKKNLPRGKWRMLTEKEVLLLKHFNKERKRQ